MNEGRKIPKEVNFPDNSGKMVLYDWMSYDGFRSKRNLVFLDPAGSLVWSAKPPDESADCFVDASLDGVTIRANTFSCRLVTLDKRTGEILSKIFTK